MNTHAVRRSSVIMSAVKELMLMLTAIRTWSTPRTSLRCDHVQEFPARLGVVLLVPVGVDLGLDGGIVRRTRVDLLQDGRHQRRGGGVRGTIAHRAKQLHL